MIVKSLISLIFIIIEFINIDNDDIDNQTTQKSRNHQKHPTRSPVTESTTVSRLFKELIDDANNKGSFSIDMNSFNKEDRKHIQNILDNLVVKKEDLSRDELSFFKEMDDIMAKNPNFKDLSPDDLIDAFGLEEGDKKELHRQLDTMISDAEKEMKQVNLTHILPGVEESVNDILLGIKNGIAANP